VDRAWQVTFVGASVEGCRAVGRCTDCCCITFFQKKVKKGHARFKSRAAFHEAVTDYIDACAKLGKQPEKPASEKLMLRVAPERRSAALIAVQPNGVSLNQWAAKALQTAAHY